MAFRPLTSEENLGRPQYIPLFSTALEVIGGLEVIVEIWRELFLSDGELLLGQEMVKLRISLYL